MSSTAIDETDIAALVGTLQGRAASLRIVAHDINPLVAVAYRRRAAELELAAVVGSAIFGVVTPETQLRELATAGFHAA